MDALTKRLIERLGELERRLAIVEAAEFLPTAQTWTPTIDGSTGSPTIAYTTQAGYYTRIGHVICYAFAVVISSISGGSGDARVSLPVQVAAAIAARNGCDVSGVDLPGTPVGVYFRCVNGTSYGQVGVIQDNAAPQEVQISGLAAGDRIASAGVYFV